MSHKLLNFCLIGLFLIGARPAGAEERMNVLLLIADDLNTWILEKPERYSGIIGAGLREPWLAGACVGVDGESFSPAVGNT